MESGFRAFHPKHTDWNLCNFPFLTQEEQVAIRTQMVGLKPKAECIHESERAAEFDGLFPA